MHKAWVWVKEHPLIIILVIGALLLLYLLFAGGSSSGSTTVVAGSAGPDPTAALQAQTQIQGAQIQAGVASQQIGAQQEVSDTQTAAALQATLSQTASGDYQAALAAKNNETGINAQEAVSLAGIQSQVQLADMANQTNQAQIQSNVDIAAINANVYKYITGQQTAQVEASYQTQTDIANINANQNIGLADIAGKTQVAVATQQAQAAETQSWTSYWTAGENKKAAQSGSTALGIVGAIASIF